MEYSALIERQYGPPCCVNQGSFGGCGQPHASEASNAGGTLRRVELEALPSPATGSGQKVLTASGTAVKVVANAGSYVMNTSDLARGLHLDEMRAAALCDALDAHGLFVREGDSYRLEE